jgi:hypothetical protein
MYMPYAWNGKLVENKQDSDAMMSVLNRLNPAYCACSVGSAGKEVGYLCPGTCLDYMYDKLGTKFAFGFEIWDGETTHGFSNVGTSVGKSFLEQDAHTAVHHARKSRAVHQLNDNEEALLLLELESERVDDATPHGHGRQSQGRLNPAENSQAAPFTPQNAAPSPGSPFPDPPEQRAKGCLSAFNPTTDASYKDTLNNWVPAYLDTVLFSIEASTPGSSV